MNLLYRHKKLVITVIFAFVLIVGLYFFISMVSNKSLEKFGNKKKDNKKDNNKDNNEGKKVKSNINKNADKILYYFYFATCPFCVKFSQDANGWPATRKYAEEKGYKVVKKDIHSDKLTGKEQEYVNKNLKTVPHLTIYNKNDNKNQWVQYEGNRDLMSLKKFIEK